MNILANKKHRNQNLRDSQNNKNDEFYTQLSDIEEELKHYKKYFENKVIYCNCDNPRFSNFFNYFFSNFHHLKLKKLIITSYQNPQPSLFENLNYQPPPVYLEYNGIPKNISKDQLLKANIKPLKGAGDFRSEECIKILSRCDIVVTNPPFSLFRDFVDHLIKYNKDFIIIGNKQAITYKNIFDLFIIEKIFFSSYSLKPYCFEIPSHYKVDHLKKKNGKFLVKFNLIRWYTTFKLPQHIPPLLLEKIYNPDSYPRYDNWDAINVDKLNEIPKDYKGNMGVPINFFDRYNPNQFKVLDIIREPRIKNKVKYKRVVIRRIGESSYSESSVS